MLATLSAITIDPAGYVEIDALPTTSDGETKRRVTRSSTLDGGSVINDGGYTEADRIVMLRWQPTVAAHDAVTRLMQLYSLINVGTRSGVYQAALDTYTPGTDEATLRLLVLSKLSE